MYTLYIHMVGRGKIFSYKKYLKPSTHKRKRFFNLKCFAIHFLCSLKIVCPFYRRGYTISKRCSLIYENLAYIFLLKTLFAS